MLLYSGAGFVIAFEIGLVSLRQRVQRLLQSEEKGSLVTLRFHHSATIHFKDEGKEIYLEGQMYDILKREERGDSLVFLCFHDVEESLELQTFSNHVQDFSDNTYPSDQKKEPSPFRGKQEYIKPDFIAFTPLSILIPEPTFAHTHVLTDVVQSVPYPPPRFQ